MEYFRSELSAPHINITKKLLTNSRIPTDYWECSLSKIPDTVPYKKDLVDYVDNISQNDRDGRCLYLYGPYGSGKSGAAVAIVKEAISRGARALFVAALELSDAFGKDTAFKNDILNTHFLILDDLGAEAKTPWSPAWIETIVKLRNNNRLPTIITSNDKPQATAERLGSLVSIMASRYKSISINGLDWRLNPPKV